MVLSRIGFDRAETRYGISSGAMTVFRFTLVIPGRVSREPGIQPLSLTVHMNMRPHPEEARSAVSKDGPNHCGLWPSFETRPSDAPQDEVRWDRLLSRRSLDSGFTAARCRE
jgi:hypothetical protein